MLNESVHDKERPIEGLRVAARSPSKQYETRPRIASSLLGWTPNNCFIVYPFMPFASIENKGAARFENNRHAALFVFGWNGGMKEI